MVSNKASPTPSVDPRLSQLFASTSLEESDTVASVSGSSVVSNPRGGDDVGGKSPASFLDSLDAVACGGGAVI